MQGLRQDLEVLVFSLVLSAQVVLPEANGFEVRPVLDAVGGCHHVLIRHQSSATQEIQLALGILITKGS